MAAACSSGILDGEGDLAGLLSDSVVVDLFVSSFLLVDMSRRR